VAHALVGPASPRQPRERLANPIRQPERPGAIAFREKDYAALSSWSRELVSIATEHTPHELTTPASLADRRAIECNDSASAREWAEQSIEIARERKTHDREATARLLLATSRRQKNSPKPNANSSSPAKSMNPSATSASSASAYPPRCLRRGKKPPRRVRPPSRWAKALADAKGFFLTEPYAAILAEMLSRARPSGDGAPPGKPWGRGARPPKNNLANRGTPPSGEGQGWGVGRCRLRTSRRNQSVLVIQTGNKTQNRASIN